ncbi:MAG: putative DNA binding domain-containing protein [Bacteroidales bacterium]
MTKEELIQRLDDIEWEDFEVKEAKSDVPGNVRETVSAFSNTSGGWIVFGVKQQGKNYGIKGVAKPDKIEQDFTTSLRGDVYNIKISPECKKYNFDEGIVLGFKIPPSNKKPVWFNNPKNTFIREALVNMLMHSDYFSSQKPRIRVFTDRIEFNNPGALPNDLDTILREDLSKPRNPVIAKIFRVINLAQNAGYGFDKMINGWNSYYHTDPEIKSGTDYYTITFKVDEKYATRKDKKASEKGGRTGGRTGGTTGGTTGGIAGEKKEEIARNEVVTKLTPRQKEVYRLIKENPQISFKEIGVRTGIKSKSTIQKHILKLRELGLIERVSTYGGYWEIL